MGSKKKYSHTLSLKEKDARDVCKVRIAHMLGCKKCEYLNSPYCPFQGNKKVFVVGKGE